MAIGAPVPGTAAELASAGTSLAVPYPEGITAGDLLLLEVSVSIATPPNNPGAAGFDSWFTGQSGSAQSPAYRVSAKVALGSETGSVTVTHSTATSKGRMWRISGVDPTTPLDVAGTPVSVAIGTALTHPGVTTTMPGCQVWAVGVRNSNSATWSTITSPFVMTEAWEDTAPLPTTQVSYRTWTGSGATGTVVFDGNTSVRSGGNVFALRPAPEATLAGQVDAATTVTGTLARSTVAGTAPVVAATTGQVTRSHLAGTVATAAVTTGTVTRSAIAAGPVRAVSSTTGTLTRSSLAGHVAAAAAVAGHLARSALTGTTAALTTVAGRVARSAIAGTVHALSTVAGSLLGGPARDITVTGSILPRRHGGSLGTRRRTGTIAPRRWDGDLR